MHHSLQTSNRLSIFADNIRKHGILARGHLLRDLDLVRHAHLSLLEWAVEVDFFDLRTEIGRRLDQGDEAVFDGQGDLGTIFDVFAERARGNDGEVGVSVAKKV